MARFWTARFWTVVLTRSRRPKSPRTPGEKLRPIGEAKVLIYFDQILSEREFLLGPFSAADIMNGSILIRAAKEGLLENHAHVARWAGVLMARPGYRRSIKK